MIDLDRLTHAAKIAGVVIVVSGAFVIALLAEREKPIRVPSKTLSEPESEDGGN